MNDREAFVTVSQSKPADPVGAHVEPMRRITSTWLLQGQRQIAIEHAGREYRLRLTSKGKLILTG